MTRQGKTKFQSKKWLILSKLVLNEEICTWKQGFSLKFYLNWLENAPTQALKTVWAVFEFYNQKPEGEVALS